MLLHIVAQSVRLCILAHKLTVCATKTFEEFIIHY